MATAVTGIIKMEIGKIDRLGFKQIGYFVFIMSWHSFCVREKPGSLPFVVTENRLLVPRHICSRCFHYVTKLYLPCGRSGKF